jgi:hypothetical protein
MKTVNGLFTFLTRTTDALFTFLGLVARHVSTAAQGVVAHAHLLHHAVLEVALLWLLIRELWTLIH